MASAALESETRTILFGTLRGDEGQTQLPRFRDQVEACATAHGGLLHGFAIDGIVVAFRTSRAAVECATEIQRLQATGVTDPGAARFAFGIHRGRVAVESGSVRGSAVDVASRLERLSDPGGVCISGSVRTELRDEMNLHTIDVGLREVEEGQAPLAVHRLIIGKTLLQPEVAPSSFEHRPIAVWATAVLALLLVTGGVGFWLGGGTTSTLPAVASSVAARPPSATGVGSIVRPTIVVVPFRTAVASVGQSVFAGGVSEALESDLLAETSLHVVVPPPHAGFGERSERNLEITRDLGARYALEGRVERIDEGSILVVAELFDAQNGFRHFHAQYERGVGELPEVRRAIRERILVALEVEAGQPSTRSSQISRQ